MKFCHLWQHGWTWGALCLVEISHTQEDEYYMMSLIRAI